MPIKQRPTVKRRRVARALRNHRLALAEHVGREVTMQEVADAVSVSRTTVVNLELANFVRVNIPTLRSILAYLEVPPDEKESLVAAAREASAPGWWVRYGDVLTGSYVGFEAESSSLSNFEIAVVPGLLQTRAYAMAHVQESALVADPAKADRFVEARMRRQEIVDDPNVEQWFVIDESAFLRLRGRPDMAAEQIKHILHIAEGDNGVNVQVMPLSAGFHAGLSGPFVILDYPDPQDPTIVYVETSTDGLFLEREEEVGRYRALFRHISATALGPSATVDHLRKIANS